VFQLSYDRDYTSLLPYLLQNVRSILNHSR
jgi:hypothetical protein